MNRPRIAFTLIELLVVVAIITLLLAILLPSLGKARATAAQQLCGSNLRQLSLAAYNYAGDYEGACVIIGETGTNGQTINSGPNTGLSSNFESLAWNYLRVYLGKSYYSPMQGLYGPYIKSAKVMLCPTFEALNIPFISVQNDYAIVQIGANKLSQIHQPDTTAVFADAVSLSTSTGTAVLSRMGDPNANGISIFGPSGYPNFGSNTYDAFHGRHANGAGEVGFYDGHVEAVKAQTRPAQTYSPAKSAAVMALVQQVGVGPLCPQWTDVSKASDPSSYLIQCKTSIDYYYWLDKGLQNYSN